LLQSIAAVKADEIIKLRDRLRMTQEQLAEKISAQRSTVARWEAGKHQPRGGYLKALRELQKKVKRKTEIEN
jgi:DNA-binding transcriptional regulator YiaG